MPVNLQAPDPADLHPVAGVRMGTAMAGVRKAGRRDVALIELAAGARVAAVFTQNRFCAAPVQVCRSHLAAGAGIRALLVNTGNANAGTGEEGLARARACCEALAGLDKLCSPGFLWTDISGIDLARILHLILISSLSSASANSAEV